jgi:regulation of enolase protein 1 (concanavalin A-like superfamily)
VQTHVEFQPRAQYDQCGLMIRADSETWIKASIEYENAGLSRLGSVVTNLGYSDWATQDIPSKQREAWYRISRNGSDFLLEHSFDGASWKQMRIAHLHGVGEQLGVGLYACSPIGKSFRCRFTLLRIGENSRFSGEG